MSQHFTEDSSSRMGVIIVGSEGTTATKYLHQMSQKLGFLAQHYRKGIEPQLFKLLNENHYNNHQTLLELLRGLEEVFFFEKEEFSFSLSFFIHDFIILEGFFVRYTNSHFNSSAALEKLSCKGFISILFFPPLSLLKNLSLSKIQ